MRSNGLRIIQARIMHDQPKLLLLHKRFVYMNAVHKVKHLKLIKEL
jgi:hypothetical protein